FTFGKPAHRGVQHVAPFVVEPRPREAQSDALQLFTRKRGSAIGRHRDIGMDPEESIRPELGLSNKAQMP
ncbi:hypothetical protein, partial [Escherichia coli]|uniref:hypothetical protein n=1 Tax=Escherichia coli TaxID=562 RepID=UPI0019534519